MEATDILDSGTHIKKLTRIQKANYEHSLSWKENGYKLLNAAKDEKEFSICSNLESRLINYCSNCTK